MRSSSKVGTLAIAVLVDLLCLIKFATFVPNAELQALIGSDILLFDKYFSWKKSFTMQLIMPAILVIAKDHVDKIVMLPGKGAYSKGIDNIFLGFLLACTKQTRVSSSF